MSNTKVTRKEGDMPGETPGDLEAMLNKPLKKVEVGPFTRKVCKILGERLSTEFDIPLPKNSDYNSVSSYLDSVLWSYLTNSEIVDYEAGIRKDKRKDKKKAAKFSPTDLKRPKSSYMMYADDTRQSVRDENPGLRFSELTTIIANKWNKLREDDPNLYEMYAERARVAQNAYYAEFERQRQEAIENCEFDEPKPKRATNAAFLYSNDKKNLEKASKEGYTKFGEQRKYLSEKWRNLSEKKKKPYLELALKDKERYEKEMEEYNARQVERRKRKEERENAAEATSVVAE